MAFRFLHCADLHIATKLSQEIALGKICDFCKMEKPDALLIAGDLFDSALPPQQSVKSVQEMLAKCGTRTFIAPGNHDPLLPGGPYDSPWPENVTVFQNAVQCFRVKDTEIWGAGFRFPRQETALLPAAQPAEVQRIGLIHGDLGTRESVYNPLPSELVAACGMDYLALGHIHKRSLLLSYGRCACAYPGVVQGRAIDENGFCGAYLGTLEGHRVSLEFLPVSDPVYLVEEMDITDVPNMVALSQKVNSLLENQGVKVAAAEITLRGTAQFALDIGELEENCSPARFYDETFLPYTLYENEPTLRGAFVREMEKRLQEAADNEREILKKALHMGLLAITGEGKRNVD